MLKNLKPLHTPEVFHTLAPTVDENDIIVVNSHFPAASMPKKLIRFGRSICAGASGSVSPINTARYLRR
jgi:L-fucose mutarotase/ribose pyranase (RbsD/FucU family)